MTPCRDLAANRANSDTRVDNAAPLTRRERDDGIQVQLRDFRNLGREPGNAQQQVAERIEIGRRMPAIPLQQRQTFDAVDQLVSIPIGQRCDAEADVTQDLDVNAAGPEAISGQQRVFRDTDRSRRRLRSSTE